MKYIRVGILVLFILQNSFVKASADGVCVGRFLNPISDICWSCLFPITIGSIPLISSSKFPDTGNPSIPLCLCKRGASPLPMPGITIGFWEPIRIIEVTRTPYCLVSLGGLKVGSSLKQGGFLKTKNEDDKKSKAFYHVHYYVYPVLALLNLLTDFGCMSVGSLDLAYMSEFDPSHLSESLANFLHPETFLLSTPVAHAACAADCISATSTKRSIDSMFWCSGCQGSIYPFTGFVANHACGVATSLLLATRQIAKLHRLGLAKKTATDSSAPFGEICESRYAARIPKSQYRLQMTYPRPNVSGEYSCNPLGMLDLLYSNGREFPYSGEDFVYLLWRKRNCCLF